MGVVKVENNTYTVSPLYQWDYNQVLEIRGLSLPTIPEIHFANELMKEALVTQGKMDKAGVITCDIPNQLLETPHKIKAYICTYEGEKFNCLYEIVIPVKPKAKPGDYFPRNDEENYSYNALENLVNNTIYTLTAQYEDYIEYSDKKYADAVNAVNKKYDETIASVNEGYQEAIDAINEKQVQIDATNEVAEQALAIAKGRDFSVVFNTTEDMEAWLSDVNNVGLLKVPDNIFIRELDVPDWWISEVLTDPDAETGYYYKISQLECTKVDLRDIVIPLLRDDWVLDETEGTYSQTVTILGLNENCNPLIVLSTANAKATEDELNAFGCLLDETEVNNGSMTFYASEAPGISFTVLAKSVTASPNDTAIADVTALVGRVSELETEVDELTNDIENYLEYGSNSNGEYYKFADGTLICTKNVSVSIAVNIAWGAIYETEYVDLGNWATSFITKPMASLNVSKGAGMIEYHNGVTTTSCGGTRFVRGASSTNTEYIVDIIGIGRWK